MCSIRDWTVVQYQDSWSHQLQGFGELPWIFTWSSWSPVLGLQHCPIGCHGEFCKCKQQCHCWTGPSQLLDLLCSFRVLPVSLMHVLPQLQFILYILLLFIFAIVGLPFTLARTLRNILLAVNEIFTSRPVYDLSMLLLQQAENHWLLFCYCGVHFINGCGVRAAGLLRSVRPVGLVSGIRAVCLLLQDKHLLTRSEE